MKKDQKRNEMSKTELIISLEDERWEEALPDFGTLSNKIVAAVFDYLIDQGDPDLLSLHKKLIIRLSLSNDLDIQSLNTRYRNIDKPTNVLSFAAIDNDDFYKNLEFFDEIDLGDIIIALETMQKEAKEKNISFSDHYAHLLTHGILHLLGFDHIGDDDADYMEYFEKEILSTLNIKNPYGD